MENSDPLSRDAQLPGQDVDSGDLDPSIAPEPGTAESAAPDQDTPDHPGADEDPELGNTLISPENS